MERGVVFQQAGRGQGREWDNFPFSLMLLDCAYLSVTVSVMLEVYERVIAG